MTVNITRHANERIKERKLDPQEIEDTILSGRKAIRYDRNCIMYKKHCPTGINIVIVGMNGTVITAYRWKLREKEGSNIDTRYARVKRKIALAKQRKQDYDEEIY